MLKFLSLVLILLAAGSAPRAWSQDNADLPASSELIDEDAGSSEPDADVAEDADSDADDGLDREEAEAAFEADDTEATADDDAVSDADEDTEVGDDGDTEPEAEDTEVTADDATALDEPDATPANPQASADPSPLPAPPAPASPATDPEATEAAMAQVHECRVSEVILVPPEFLQQSHAAQGRCLRASGNLVSINQNQMLFSLLGTEYGGDGTTNFAIPDLRGLTEADGRGYCICAWGRFPVGPDVARIRKANCALQQRAKPGWLCP